MADDEDFFDAFAAADAAAAVAAAPQPTAATVRAVVIPGCVNARAPSYPGPSPAKDAATLSRAPPRTPDYFHVLEDAALRAAVYEPEADSFLMLQALDAAGLGAPSARRPLVCAEIGVGSGIALTHLATLLAAAAGPDPLYVGVDVNPVALRATRETFRRTFANVVAPPREPPPLLLVRGDLLSWTAAVAAATSATATRGGPATYGPIDVLLFNPPYVPTSAAELAEAVRGGKTGGDWLPSAWAGGPDGRLVLDRCLPQLPAAMARGGEAFVVAMEENDPPGILRRIGELAAAAGRTARGAVSAQRYTGERLRVLRVTFDGPEA